MDTKPTIVGRSVAWVPLQWPGAEHLVLREEPEGWLARSMVVWVYESQPLSVRYAIHCDPGWRVRRAGVCVWAADRERTLRLRHDGAGHWTDSGGQPLAGLEGCSDLDLMATPFTNTLPVRRLHLPVGSSQVLRVAYVSVPDLAVKAVEQRYTHLEDLPGGGSRYRYEGLDSGFRAEIELDSDGLVRVYQDLWRMEPA
jgi:uncharacterized protein